jgi:hypothetical protein
LKDQQNEIKDFTEGLEKGKVALEQQLKMNVDLFKKNSEKALDAELQSARARLTRLHNN